MENTFSVDVKRATPACDANCPDLEIDVDHLKYYADVTEKAVNRVTCVNDSYCKRLWDAMQKKLS